MPLARRHAKGVPLARRGPRTTHTPRRPGPRACPIGQSLPDWIASHERAFAFFGGVPAQVVPDNLKSGVTKACFYDPEINRTYADLAAHYDTAVVPARPHKPKE